MTVSRVPGRAPDSVPGTPRLLRAINDRAALELLLRHGPLSRPQLGALTGLSKPTASQLLVRLESRGLVEAVGEQEGGRGPNARLYAVRGSCAYVVGVDVGPRSLKAVVADIAGAVVGSASVPAGEQGAAADPVSLVHDAVASAAADAGFASSRLRRVVIGTPGLVDPATGDLRFAWDLPSWHDGLRSLLGADLGAPVTFENDVSLAAIAERHDGAAVDRDDFALMWIGRGLGLAVVLGGRVHRGASGGAGEIGYLPVPGAPVAQPARDADAYPGGFQSLVSTSAVRELARASGVAAADAPLAAVLADDALLDELARRLALGVAAVCAVVDPGVIVLAGEVGRAGGQRLADRVALAVPLISPLRPELRVTAVADDPVLRGTILSALDVVRDEVFGSTTA